jgi:hypothetical protein
LPEIRKAEYMTEKTEMYAGIEGKILVYHSPYYHKHAYFYRIISQTPKSVVVQALETRVFYEYIIGGYQNVVPDEEPPFGEPKRMFKTFEQPYLVKGYVEVGTKRLKLWDGAARREDPMY